MSYQHITGPGDPAWQTSPPFVPWPKGGWSGTAEEIREIDPDTGGQKGQKPEQYSLIPTEALAEVARVYAYGARKYTTYGECTCVHVGATEKSTHEDCVETATTRISNDATLNTPSDSDRTFLNGSDATAKELQHTAERIAEAERRASGGVPCMESLPSSMRDTSQSLAGSVEHLASALTTATSAASGAAGNASAGAYATGATSASGISKAGMPSTPKLHKPGCAALRVVSQGRDNWRKGYAWHLSYDAMQRHLNAFWSGEEIDPESNLPHLAHAIFHCMTLLVYANDEKYKGKDDRA